MKYVFIVSVLSLLLYACDNTTIVETGTNSPPLINESEEDNKIYIMDDTGKQWDVTNAVKKYGMLPDQFQYGLGPYAIRPILNPKFLTPNEPGWPSTGDFLVIATRINGDARAYPINIMKSFEIANETFGDTLVAVAY
jgi:hypothetical protein